MNAHRLLSFFSDGHPSCRHLLTAATAAGFGLTASAQNGTFNLSIDASTSISPVVDTFGWDIKGSVGHLNSQFESNLLYNDTPANILRVPIYANAHAENGSVDLTDYAPRLEAIQRVQISNPDAKIFAGIKLLGGDTFPSWIDSAQNGQIFGNPAARPDADKYSTLVADYVEFMQGEGVRLDYLGLSNETDGVLEPARYIDTARMLRQKLIDRGVPAEFRDFQLIGPDTFDIDAGVAYAQEVQSLGGLDTIDVAGSHLYFGQNDGAEEWQALDAATGNAPLWHTEIHLTTGTDPEYPAMARMRERMGVLFESNQGGATGFVFWGDGSNQNRFDQTLKRELLTTMMGAHQVATSPNFDPEATALNTELFQAFRNGDELTIWFANPQGPWREFVDVALGDAQIIGEIDSLYFQAPVDDRGTYDLSLYTVGELDITIDVERNGFVINPLFQDTIARVTLSLLPDDALPGDANLDGAVNLLDLDILGTNWQQPGGWINGDFNKDGTINLLDLDILGTNWGVGTVEFAAAASALGIPEPASVSLLVFGAAGVIARRRR